MPMLFFSVPFNVVPDNQDEKNCNLAVIGALDRETKSSYEFNVTVRFKSLTQSGRKKRQADSTVFKYSKYYCHLYSLLPFKCQVST